MHFLHAINTDRQTRLLNVFGQIEMFWEIKQKLQGAYSFNYIPKKKNKKISILIQKTMY
jgi:hypothetical protein